MKERPILFSAPMVRALLAGTKTQTRRIVKVPKRLDGFSHPSAAGVDFSCPYGWRSDRLWVRESWYTASNAYDDLSPSQLSGEEPILCRATHPRISMSHGRIRAAMHMPRWASRITLWITDVRVERLNDISETDAISEGIERVSGDTSAQPWRDYSKDQRMRFFSAPSASYRSLWESINGEGSWDANPFVWVIEFRRLPDQITEKRP